jgi:hypothetical protein
MNRRVPTTATRLVIAALAFGISAFSTRSASADITYQYVTDASDYQVIAGQSVVVPLYLQETVTGADTSLLAAEDGLFGAGLTVSRVTEPSSPAFFDALDLNPSFDFGTPVNSTSPGTFTPADNSASLNEAVAEPDGVQAVDLGGGISRVFLGSVTIQAGNVLQQATAFSVGPNGDTGGNTLTFTNFYDLDITSGSPAFTGALASPAFTFTVTAVPEPASLSLLSVAAVAMLGRPARRSKR